MLYLNLLKAIGFWKEVNALKWVKNELNLKMFLFKHVSEFETKIVGKKVSITSHSSMNEVQKAAWHMREIRCLLCPFVLSIEDTAQPTITQESPLSSLLHAYETYTNVTPRELIP